MRQGLEPTCALLWHGSCDLKSRSRVGWLCLRLLSLGRAGVVAMASHGCDGPYPARS
jgi:hypothetical protein